MQQSHDRDQEVQALRERLSRLSQASLRINESLDFDTVLQDVVDSARTLTGSRYGAITVFGEAGQTPDFIVSGLTREEHRELWEIPQGLGFFEYLSGLETPLRLSNVTGYLSALGMGDFTLPVSVSAALVAPIRHRGVGVGTIYLAHETAGQEFGQEDAETLVMFAAQAALVIANARRHREERKAKADLEALVNTSPVGVVVFDAVLGAPLSFNREARRIVDCLRDPDQDVDELLEVVSFQRADGREISLAELPLARALSANETVRAEEIVISVPDGRSVTTLINATPIPSEEGVVDTVVVTLQDLSPLEDIQRQRTEFLSLVSHELRAPLTSIKGSAVNLRESLNSLDPAEVFQFVHIIESQADRMRDLIGNLLDIARIESGQLSVFPEPADVASLVDEARSAFLVSRSDVNLTLDLDPDLPWVMADRRRVVQVVANLLSNAARHSRDASPIRLSAALEDGHVAVSVTDQGRGVEPEQLPFLFQKFSRTDDEREAMGHGLGLAICRGIVEAHGGRIWAESQGLGQGSRFTFTLTVAESAPTAGTRRYDRRRRQPVGQGKVLVVDDDPMTLRSVRDTLSKSGYAPLVTADPEEALRLFDTERPALVLLDLVLPGSDGIDLMGKMLNVALVPVIFLSAYNREETIVRAFEMGAIDYIVKPFSPTELEARVQAALRRRLLAPSPWGIAKPFVLGDLTLNYADRAVSVAGRPVRLTHTEYEILFQLSREAGRPVDFEYLQEQLWGPGHPEERGSLRSHVKRLRRKLGETAANPQYIFSEPRVGYRMPRPDTEADEEEEGE